MSVFFSDISTHIYAQESDKEKEDKIVTIGMNMYEDAYKWEIETIEKFTTEAYEKFANKVNLMIDDDPALKKRYKDKCSDCMPIIKDTLDDDEELKKYLQDKPEAFGPELFIILVRHHNEGFKGDKALPNDIFRDLTVMVENTIVKRIRTQVKEQTAYFRDVARMWLYLDGDIENSPYDLLDDIRNIDKIFFRLLPKLWSYKNTSEDDQEDLIKKKKWEKQQEEEQKEENMEQEEICDHGYCIVIKTVRNRKDDNNKKREEKEDDLAFFTQEYDDAENEDEENKNSFQEIFEDASRWIIDEWDNLNLACRVSPTIQFFETKFTQSVKIYKIFSGSSIFPYWTPPPLLINYFRRRNIEIHEERREDDKSDEKKEEEEDEDADKRVILALERSFRRYDLDFYRPTNINASLRQLFLLNQSTASTNTSDMGELASSTVEGQLIYDQQIAWSGSIIRERPFVTRFNLESYRHLQVAFDDIANRTRMLYEYSHPLETIVNYILAKDDCPWS